jgi:hypothetical protein
MPFYKKKCHALPQEHGALQVRYLRFIGIRHYPRIFGNATSAASGFRDGKENQENKNTS